MLIRIYAVLGFFIAAYSFVNASDGNRAKIGIGAGIDVFALPSVPEDSRLTIPEGIPSLTVPIYLSPELKFEPVFSFFTVQSTLPGDQLGILRVEKSSTYFNIGAGIYYSFLSRKDARGYLGGRFTYTPYSLYTESTVSASGSKVSTTDDNQSIISAAVIIGGEYFPADCFSIGIDAGLAWFNFSKPSFTPAPEPSRDQEYKYFIISQVTSIMARFYFN